jgi:hypothetical protein
MDLINRLQEQFWLFDDLLGPFLSQLESSPRLSFLENPHQLPGFIKTISYYKVIDESSILAAIATGAFLDRVPATKEAQAAWQSFAERLPGQPQGLARLSSVQQETLQSSWNKLHELDSTSGQQFSKAITNIIPLETTGFAAASAPHFFGCIFVTPEWLELSAPEQMLSLVHEMAHQELFLVNLVDRLVNSSADYSLVHAPLQGKARPPIGRLHAAHALYRMVQFQTKLGWDCEENQMNLKATCKSFLETELTPFAIRLIENVYLV